MTAAKISLGQQIEAVRFAETRQRHLATGGSVRAQRAERVEQFDLERLGAAARTLEWLQKHEDEIKAFLTLDPADRAGMICMISKAAADKLGGPAPEA